MAELGGHAVEVEVDESGNGIQICLYEAAVRSFGDMLSDPPEKTWAMVGGLLPKKMEIRVRNSYKNQFYDSLEQRLRGVCSIGTILMCEASRSVIEKPDEMSVEDDQNRRLTQNRGWQRIAV
jgi:hypothetical protein